MYILWWHTPQCCVHYLPCRLNQQSFPDPMYDEYECMDWGSGGKVLASATKNRAHVTTNEAVTSFSSGTEGEREKEDQVYEVLPFEATADSGQCVPTDELYM